MLMLLHKPTQEGVSGLRHWVHFSRKVIKNPPKYLSTISWKPSAGPLSCYTLWWVTSSITESELSLSPLQPCLMVRYLQDPRHDGAGRSPQLHIFRASAICERYEDERGTVCKNSGVQGRKKKNPWTHALVRTKSHPGAQRKIWGFKRVWWFILLTRHLADQPPYTYSNTYYSESNFRWDWHLNQ